MWQSRGYDIISVVIKPFSYIFDLIFAPDTYDYVIEIMRYLELIDIKHTRSTGFHNPCDFVSDIEYYNKFIDCALCMYIHIRWKTEKMKSDDWIPCFGSRFIKKAMGKNLHSFYNKQ